MAGAHGVIQALVSQRLGKNISYIYCLNYQIHLAVVSTLASHKNVCQYLETCEEFHKFFRRQPVVNVCTSNILTGLMEDGWRGRFATTEIITENKAEVESALTNLSEG